MKDVFITGISSDIGKYLAECYMRDGWTVGGTYRTEIADDFRRSIAASGGKCYQCDFSIKADIQDLIENCKRDNMCWDLLISSVGNLEPIGKFKEIDFDEWEQSIHINAISQLRFLHGVYDLKKGNSTILFFAGGGTNSAFTNYSAYCISKILLIKMCELLDDEDESINVVIVGPGMIGTKIHGSTLKHQAAAGDNYFKTIQFLETEGDVYQKSMERVYRFICWAEKNGRDVCSGRNFSVVHDKWEEDNNLINELLKDDDMYKLRRYKN